MTPRRPLLSLILLLLSCSTLAAGQEQPKVLFDRWYVMLLENQPAGWTHVWVTQTGEVIATHEESSVSVKRGPIALTVESRSTFEESAAGKPMVARTMQKLGATEVHSTMTFGPRLIEVVSEQNGQKQTQTYPLPREAWLPPAAAQRQFERQMAAGDTQMSLWTLNPAMGPRAFELKVKVAGPANVEVMGKVVPAVLWETTMSVLPGVVMRSYVDEGGQPVKTTTSLMPGMELTMLQADEALARQQVNPPEMLLNTLVPVKTAIADPRAKRRGVYELTIAGEKTAQPELPSAGAQQVKWDGPGRAIVTVDLDQPAALEAGPVEEKYRRATMMLNSEDPQVVALLRQALGAGGQPGSSAEQAEKLRRFVHEYIDAKDLSVGLASAGEVARTRQGDCTEHAMLLAALLRAAGIPSRTVTGLVYADGFVGQEHVFGYHMWTQAWLAEADGRGRWVDLDATLHPEHAYDATHLTLATSAQDADGVSNDLVALLPVIGQLRIKVVE